MGKLLLVVGFVLLAVVGCKREEKVSPSVEAEEYDQETEEDYEEETNVIEDYISNPQDKARAVNKQIEDRYRQIDEAAGE